MQVILADIVIYPHDTSLDESERTLGGVRIHIATGIFPCTVTYALMATGEVLTDSTIPRVVVGDDTA